MIGWIVASGLAFACAALIVENWRLYRQLAGTKLDVERFTQRVIADTEKRLESVGVVVEGVDVVPMLEPDTAERARYYIRALQLAQIEIGPRERGLIEEAVEEGWSTSVLYRKVKEVRDGSA